jgi:hypothetical protein
MIPADYIQKRDEVAHKIAELKMWIADKETVEYKNYIDNGGNARSAKDKVLSELKFESEDWMAKEVELEELKKTYTTMSFVLETLQKMISTVSAGFMSVDEYNQWVRGYGEFFKKG